MINETRKQKYEVLRVALEQDRSSFTSHWRDLADHVLPRRLQLNTSDTNRGEKRNQKIINATATLAARTLRAGMMGGITSPARPWKRLTTPDPDLAEFGPVKDWLHIVDQRMSTVFLRSNLYNALPTGYGDLGTFGTAAIGLEEDFDSTIRLFPFPIGSYALALNDKLQVDVFFREFRYTVRQLVNKFGQYDGKSGSPKWDVFSSRVKQAYDEGRYNDKIDVCHIIQQNSEYKPNSLTSKKYSSVYYEKGQGSDKQVEDKFLRDAGYDYFPILAPRWEVAGGDVYGTECPGMTALGDVKALQLLEKRKAQAIEKYVNPPMTGPSSLRNQKASILPGDMTYSDEREGMKGFRPVHEVRPEINGIVMDIQEKEKRIQRCFYEDLFLMLAYTDRRQITAREVEERHEEKLLALGPVLEQLNQDLLDPLIDITFDIMVRQGLIPEPPEELQGVQLKVEYVSIMHQAQKLAGLSGIERFTAYVGQLAAVNPEIIDKVDMDQAVDEYGSITGVPPRIIRPDEAVAEMRAQRAQAVQAQQQSMAMAEGAKAAKDLSGASLEGNNALTEMLKMAQAGQMN
jgi:hypothetical protein